MTSEAFGEADFGRIARGEATGVERPSTLDGLVETVRRAGREGVALTPRGAGLSQSGQSVAKRSRVLDTSALDSIEVEGESVRCGAGARFSDVVERCAQERRIPEVLPLNLDLSIGGVLSAGGFGSTSHQRGLVVQSVESMDAVLGSGELRRGLDDDVRDAVLGGLGRCGVLAQATLKTRPLARSVRTHYLLYDDFEAFVHDQSELQQRVEHVDAFCSAAVQGLRLGAHGRRPFARWFYALHPASERERSDQDVLSGLSYREHLGAEQTDPTEHARRFEMRFRAMRATGGWDQSHPWIEAFVPRSSLSLIPSLLEQIPLFLGSGHRLGMVRTEGLPTSVAVPDDASWAFAILPMGVPEALLPGALQALRKVHDALLFAGAKRYLSGWLFEPDGEFWQSHYGDSYARWRSLKERFDPNGVLRSRLFGRPGD